MKQLNLLLVIDLFQPSPVAQQLKKFDTNVSNVLKEVKIPVLHKEIKPSYSTEDLRIEILKAMDSSTVAYLKGRTIEETKK